MIESDNNTMRLPKGWVQSSLGEIAEINPKLPCVLQDNTEVSFLPMKAVEELTGKFDASTVVLYIKVKKGYTAFINGDIIFAKITPCMENGKVAVVGNLKNGVGFGSTEFHVIRPFLAEFPRKYLFYYLIQESFRRDAKRDMTGSAGQLRVQAKYMQDASLPLPPVPEQVRIVARLEELFTRLDAGIEGLRKVKAQLERYRQAVLKYAFKGKLTEEWRKTHKDQLEPATKLLEHIKQERKQKLGPKYKEPPPIDASELPELPELPESWMWTRIGEISDLIHYGYTASSTTKPIGPKMLRITDIQANTVNWDDVPYCKIDDNTKQKYILRDGDLVFARTGATVGKSFLIKGYIPEAVFASYLIRIILSKNVKKEFVYHFFHSPSYWLQIRKQQLGIGQPNVNSQTLARIVLPLPSLAEQDRIAQEIESRLSVVEETLKTLDRSMKQSERLRQTILNKAFTGKLVPQDPSDEPAEKLLERIKEERAKSKGEKDINKKKNKPKQLELPTYVK